MLEYTRCGHITNAHNNSPKIIVGGWCQTCKDKGLEATTEQQFASRIYKCGHDFKYPVTAPFDYNLYCPNCSLKPGYGGSIGRRPELQNVTKEFIIKEAAQVPPPQNVWNLPENKALFDSQVAKEVDDSITRIKTTEDGITLVGGYKLFMCGHQEPDHYSNGPVQVWDSCSTCLKTLKTKVTIRTCGAGELQETRKMFNTEAFPIIDCRIIQSNPHNEKNLRGLNGTNKKIQEYVLKHPATTKILGGLIGQLNKGERNFLLFCMKGKHRSVAVAEILSGIAQRQGYPVRVEHRAEGINYTISPSSERTETKPPVMNTPGEEN